MTSHEESLPECPRCGSPLVDGDLHVGPMVGRDEQIYARRFVCGTWDDPESPIYKACNYIQTVRKRYAS